MYGIGLESGMERIRQGLVKQDTFSGYYSYTDRSGIKSGFLKDGKGKGVYKYDKCIGEVDKDGNADGFGQETEGGGLKMIGHCKKGSFGGHHFEGHLMIICPWGEIVVGEMGNRGLFGHVIKMRVTDKGLTPQFWVYKDGNPVNKVGQVLSQKEFEEEGKNLLPRVREGMQYSL